MDIAYLLFLQNIREALGGYLNSFFVFISSIAVDYYIMVPALILFWTIDKKRGSRVLLTLGTSLGIGAFLKSTFCVYRPWIRDSRVTPPEEILHGATGYSFPSGHSFGAGGLWNALAVNYRKYRGFVIMCVIMVLLTMFSRNFLGVHTPQDVLAGAGVSLLCAFGICKLCDLIDRRPNLDWVVLAVVTALVAVLLVYIRTKSYPQDYVDGVLLVDPKKMTVDGFKDPGRFYGIVLGWFIERRWIRFETEGTLRQKVVRAFVGALLTVFWWTAVADTIGKICGMGIMHFVAQASTPLVMMTVYPLLFKKLEKKSA